MVMRAPEAPAFEEQEMNMQTRKILAALTLGTALIGAGAAIAQNAGQGQGQGQGQGMGQGIGQGMGHGQGMGDGMMGGMMGGMMPDFAALDADGDGKVSREEFRAYRQAMVSGIDGDGDGKISAAELEAHMSVRMAERIREMAEARIAAQDLDGDGALSIEEMIAPPMPPRLFDRADADGEDADGIHNTRADQDLWRGRGGGACAAWRRPRPVRR